MFDPLGFPSLPAYPVPRQMALESKPLFHPEVLRQQVRSFNLPEQTAAWQPKLQHWADLITSGRADDFKETALLPDFLTDIFCGLLGYTGPAEAADTYTLSRERHVEVDGKFADAVAGPLPEGQGAIRRRPGRQGHPRSAGPPVCRAAHVRRGPGLPLRHQPPVRLDHRHLHARDAAVLQRRAPAGLRTLRDRPPGRR